MECCFDGKRFCSIEDENVEYDRSATTVGTKIVDEVANDFTAVLFPSNDDCLLDENNECKLKASKKEKQHQQYNQDF